MEYLHCYIFLHSMSCSFFVDGPSYVCISPVMYELCIYKLCMSPEYVHCTRSLCVTNTPIDLRYTSA